MKIIVKARAEVGGTGYESDEFDVPGGERFSSQQLLFAAAKAEEQVREMMSNDEEESRFLDQLDSAGVQFRSVLGGAYANGMDREQTLELAKNTVAFLERQIYGSHKA